MLVEHSTEERFGLPVCSSKESEHQFGTVMGGLKLFSDESCHLKSHVHHILDTRKLQLRGLLFGSEGTVWDFCKDGC